MVEMALGRKTIIKTKKLIRVIQNYIIVDE